MTLPILYSFRRCPYAIRTRLALAFAQQTVALREIVLKDKPAAMLAISPKATVPVLQLPDGRVLDESRDIILWTLARNDPQQFLPDESGSSAVEALIDENDGFFKHWLDRYKYADRYPEQNQEHYRQQGEVFLQKLDTRLTQSRYLCSQQPGLADIAIMPFVRQFAHVNKSWFDNADYPALQAWLSQWLESSIFLQTMHKYPQWHEDDEATLFNPVTEL